MNNSAGGLNGPPYENVHLGQERWDFFVNYLMFKFGIEITVFSKITLYQHLATWNIPQKHPCMNHMM